MQQFDLIFENSLNRRLFFHMLMSTSRSAASSLRPEVLPAGETGELHPAADPPESLLRLPGKVRLQSRRPPSHPGRRSCDEAARRVDLGPATVSSWGRWLLSLGRAFH